MKSLCVFCGSNPGHDEAYVEAARHLGGAMAGAGCRLIYGGGSGGLMGTVADAVLEQGGEAIGVVPTGLFGDEHVHRGLSQLEWVENMAERKARMTELSDGFVVLAGGLGTLDELFEMWVSAQLNIEQLPVGLLNTSNYYTLMLEFLDHSVTEGFVSQVTRDMLVCESQPATLVERMLAL